MDRRRALRRFALLRKAIRKRLPAPIEAWALRRWNRLERAYRRHRADVVLVSYPKAGRTWLQVMLGRVLAQHFGIDDATPGQLESLHDADARVPRVLSSHDGVLPGMRPSEIRRDKTRYHGHAVILLVRDPRDVVVSDFHHLRSRGFTRETGERAPPMLDRGVDVDTFVRSERSGFATVLAFHRAWHEALGVPRRLLLVRYEDLRVDPARELQRILVFLGLPEVSEACLASAVRDGAFEAMQRGEREGAYASPVLRPADPNDPSTFKVRRGAVGGYRDELSAATSAWLDATLRNEPLPRFGYE